MTPRERKDMPSPAQRQQARQVSDPDYYGKDLLIGILLFCLALACIMLVFGDH